MTADGRVLIVRAIEVTYHLSGVSDPEARATAERVHGFHADRCPVARSISGCIDISTRLVFVE